MNHDDADPDDAGLDGLRSMFRSLPDEEPPARGLDALMAAARVKANEMAEVQPSLWERFVAMMRRPQVLALATIMILIGGAVFISQRSDKLESAGPQVQQELDERARVGTPQAPNGEPELERSAADRPMSTPAGQNEPTIGHAGSGPAGQAVATPVEASKSDLKTPEPTSPRSRTMKTGGTVAKTPPKPAPRTSRSGARYDDNAVLSSDPFGGEATGAPGGAMAPADSAKDEAGPTVKQLHAQARAAAAKQDCATVKSLAKLIASKDAPYYRANIATDTTLAGCLN